MSIWAIADIHASRTNPATQRPLKPMDVFGPEWANHMGRLEAGWKSAVGEDDTVIVAGDIDWGLRLEEALETLLCMETWPGHKILVRGNHDYWWSSKTTNRVRQSLPPTIDLLHNNTFQADGFNICGAKGSPVPGGIDWTEENEKLLNRELQRLNLSLEAADPQLPGIVALHYPPFYRSHPESPYKDVMEQREVVACVYGHLHGEAAETGPNGLYGRIQYSLVAGDALDFRPLLVAAHGRVLPPVGGSVPPQEQEKRMRGQLNDRERHISR